MSHWLLALGSIFIACITSVVVFKSFFKRRYSYWKNVNVAYIEPKVPFGNADSEYSPGEGLASFYHAMKAKGVRYAGMYFFHLPIFVPIDPDLIKRILVTDFTHFTDHGIYMNERDDPLSAHIFAQGGARWRESRAKLSPTFTSGKMKGMLAIVVKITEELVRVLGVECESGPIESKDVSARFTTDIIGNCAFGIDCNTLKDPDVEFRRQAKRLFDLTKSEQLLSLLSFLCPDLMRKLRIRMFPQIATDFFLKVIQETTKYREKNGVRRNDALQLLLDMKNDSSGESLTFDELAGQAFVFFIAGFDTSATLISFALLELGLNEDVQEKLREETISVLGDEITYEDLARLAYMDMVINETLRKYPPIPNLIRLCTKDYRIPDTDVVIFKGQRVFTSVQGIHYDPEYYPDPEKFDPNRFSEENKSKRHQFAFLPFGEGPRFCLGTTSGGGKFPL